jgi:hypothetical protein
MMPGVGTDRDRNRAPLEGRLLLRISLFGFERSRQRDTLGSLKVVIYEPVKGTQRHTWAHVVADDLYEVLIPAPGPGPCYLFFACPRSGIGYAELPHFILQTSIEGYTLLRRPAETGAADVACQDPAG